MMTLKAWQRKNYTPALNTHQTHQASERKRQSTFHSVDSEQHFEETKTGTEMEIHMTKCDIFVLFAPLWHFSSISFCIVQMNSTGAQYLSTYVPQCVRASMEFSWIHKFNKFNFKQPIDKRNDDIWYGAHTKKITFTNGIAEKCRLLAYQFIWFSSFKSCGNEENERRWDELT